VSIVQSAFLCDIIGSSFGKVKEVMKHSKSNTMRNMKCVLCLTLLFPFLMGGCSDSYDNDAAYTFHRFVEHKNDENQITEIKVRYGQEYRNVLMAPYSTGIKLTFINKKGQISLKTSFTQAISTRMPSGLLSIFLQTTDQIKSS
jgi:hypothetical protein